MPRLKVSHITTYDYANPVTFGEHRMMFRPRDSHDLRILSTNLIIEPQPTAGLPASVTSACMTETLGRARFRSHQFPITPGFRPRKVNRGRRRGETHDHARRVTTSRIGRSAAPERPSLRSQRPNTGQIRVIEPVTRVSGAGSGVIEAGTRVTDGSTRVTGGSTRVILGSTRRVGGRFAVSTLQSRVSTSPSRVSTPGSREVRGQESSRRAIARPARRSVASVRACLDVTRPSPAAATVWPAAATKPR